MCHANRLASICVLVLGLSGGALFAQAAGKPEAVRLLPGGVTAGVEALGGKDVPAPLAAPVLPIPGAAGKWEPRLLAAWQAASTKGAAPALQMLKDNQVSLAANGQDVVVIVTLAPEADAPQVETRLKALGATILRPGPGTLKIAVPLAALEAIAGMDDVLGIRTIKPPSLKVTTQGVSATLANAWHAAGLTGQGVKVAIVDPDFANHELLKTLHELPASAIEVNYTATSMNNGSDSHGSACAEIVYDMAPGAQLYLIKVDDATDLVAVKDYCIANGIAVISCSLGWDAMNFHDGIAYANQYSSVATHPVTAVDLAAAGGVLWVNAAGNEQKQHTLIDWRDGGASPDHCLDWNSDRDYLNPLFLDGSFTIPANTWLDIYMTWNQWPLTDQDFDLELYKNTGSGWTRVSAASMVIAGNRTQDGSSGSDPSEEAYYKTTAAGYYAVVVKGYNTSTAPTFVLRCYGIDEPTYFGYGNLTNPAPGSISIPGDTDSAFTVGAINYAKYATGPTESFSSRGPNNRAYTGGTAVTKPDVCGPDRTASSTYGSLFAGTSAATPHIAGLAALVKGAHPGFTVQQIREFIEQNANDLGIAGKDNTYGSGPARLPAPLFSGRVIGLSGNLAFGDVTTGRTATATMTITNRGDETLTVTGIEYPAGFSGAWSGTIPSAGSQGVTVSFSPEGLQAYGGTVTVNSDKTDGGNTLAISGVGIVASPGRLSFSAASYSAQEGAVKKVLVRRLNGSVGAVSVKYVTKPKTALAWSDYTPKSGTLTWADGDTVSKAIKIPVLADGRSEANEAFQVVLKNPVGATLAAPYNAKVIILANSKDARDVQEMAVVRLFKLTDALDGEGLAWFTSASSPWTAQAVVTADDVDAAVSGQPDPGRVSWLQTDVDGAGTLRFDWFVKGSGLDACLLIVDGKVAAKLGPAFQWVHESVALGEGAHTVRWAFAGESRLLPGAAYLDHVSWTPAGAP